MAIKLKCLFAALVFWFSLVAYADDSEQVKSIVQKNVDSILQTFESEKASFETDPDGFYSKMERAVADIIDFRRIAARVMGKYGKRANKDQRDQFVDVFKSSLFRTYTATLVNSGSFEMKVVKAEINPRSDDRASVDMEVTSNSGNIYPVTYSMYRSKEGAWLMENVIVFGVNIGLAFRDKFENEMRSYDGNIDQVIANWTVDIKIESPEAKKES